MLFSCLSDNNSRNSDRAIVFRIRTHYNHYLSAMFDEIGELSIKYLFPSNKDDNNTGYYSSYSDIREKIKKAKFWLIREPC